MASDPTNPLSEEIDRILHYTANNALSVYYPREVTDSLIALIDREKRKAVKDAFRFLAGFSWESRQTQMIPSSIIEQARKQLFPEPPEGSTV